MVINGHSGLLQGYKDISTSLERVLGLRVVGREEVKGQV